MKVSLLFLIVGMLTIIEDIFKIRSNFPLHYNPPITESVFRNANLTQANHPPKVTILAPSHQQLIPGQQIPYSIKVVDVEDGSTEYGEIEVNKIFLEVKYLPSGNQIDKDPSGPGMHAEATGLQKIKDRACFNCHAHRSSYIGPSFSTIAQRYRPEPQNLTKLTFSILEGSLGNWGSEPMPAQVDIAPQEAQMIARWILNEANIQQITIYAGHEGSFTSYSEFEDGAYLLTASYTDQGLPDLPGSRLTGTDSIMLSLK